LNKGKQRYVLIVVEFICLAVKHYYSNAGYFCSKFLEKYFWKSDLLDFNLLLLPLCSDKIGYADYLGRYVRKMWVIWSWSWNLWWASKPSHYYVFWALVYKKAHCNIDKLWSSDTIHSLPWRTNRLLPV